MVLDTIIDKWFSTQDQKVTWAISLAFLIIFPIYFANMAAFLPDGSVIGADIAGEWEISFEEKEIATFESTETLLDDEEFDFEMTFDDANSNLAYVEVTVAHGETDENGQWPDQCDDAQGEMVMDGIGSYIETGSTLTGSSGNQCPTTYTMRIMMLENYTGDTYVEEGQRSVILANWTSADDAGRGDWIARITLETRTGSKPGPFDPLALSNNENGEDITVTMRFVGVTASAKMNIDPTL
jgi:hypothetical protein